MEMMLETAKRLELALRAKVEKLVEEKNEIADQKKNREQLLNAHKDANAQYKQADFDLRREVSHYRIELRRAHTLLGRIVQQHSNVSRTLNLSQFFPIAEKIATLNAGDGQNPSKEEMGSSWRIAHETRKEERPDKHPY